MTNTEIKSALTESMKNRLHKYDALSTDDKFSFVYKLRKRRILKTAVKQQREECTESLCNKNIHFFPKLKFKIMVVAILVVSMLVTGFCLVYTVNGFSFENRFEYSVVHIIDYENLKTSLNETYKLSDECGYEKSYSEKSTYVINNIYYKNNVQIILTQRVVGHDGNLGHINTENSTVEEIYVNNNKGFIVSRDNYTGLWWQMDGYIFSIQGEINKSTAIELAQMTVLE